jgi:hypothetical protein
LWRYKGKGSIRLEEGRIKILRRLVAEENYGVEKGPDQWPVLPHGKGKSLQRMSKGGRRKARGPAVIYSRRVKGQGRGSVEAAEGARGRKGWGW